MPKTVRSSELPSLDYVHGRIGDIITEQGFLIDQYKATYNKKFVTKFKRLSREFKKLHELEKKLRSTLSGSYSLPPLRNKISREEGAI